MLAASFPKTDLGMLAWLGLVPLLRALHNRSLIWAFFLSGICGVFFFLGLFNWILVVKGYRLLHHAILAVYLGSYFGFFGLFFALMTKRSGPKLALSASPFIWVSMEYVRSNLSFMALPWGLLGHTQYRYTAVIQVASLFGTYGISFMIVTANAALLMTIHKGVNVFRRQKDFGRDIASEEFSPIFVLSTVGLIAFALLYGYWSSSMPVTGEKIRISLVQGNIEQSKKWDGRYAREIMRIYENLTKEAARQGPELIVWPETATPGSINHNPDLRNQLKRIARQAHAYILSGSARNQKFDITEKGGVKYTNLALLIPPGFGLFQQYNKIRLFPFGEYLPYKGIIPWHLVHISGNGTYLPGEEFTVFRLPDARFAVTICWENVFPDFVRRFVKKGAQFLININNEARFGRTAAPYQLLAISVFRAVENRVFVVRCGNTGVSCVIDPFGRIVKRLKDNSGQDVFVRGVLNGWVIPSTSKTFYTRHGDVAAWGSLLGAFLICMYAIFSRRRQPTL